jgi:hypothetical protein
MIDRPIVYGSSFKRPSKKTLRIDRAQKGPKLLTRNEILAMIAAAGMPLKAMILLGINAGMATLIVARCASRCWTWMPG